MIRLSLLMFSLACWSFAILWPLHTIAAALGLAAGTAVVVRVQEKRQERRWSAEAWGN